MNKTTRCKLIAWSIWMTAAIFYAYEYFIRISPAVMVPNLMQAFKVDAAELGSLSAFYYYAYAIMQIPVGLLLDRYGIRLLLTVAATMVALGNALFASTDHLWLAEFGRVMMGAGSAFSFVGCLKLAANWFEARRLAVVIGLTNMLGVIGALTAEAPLSLLVNHFGWRITMLMAGIIGAFFALLISLIIKDKPKYVGCDTDNNGSSLPHPVLESLKRVLKNRRIWLIAAYGGLMVAPIAAFTELWSVPFFRAMDDISSPKAAAISSVVFIGIAVGGPVNGWLSGVIGKRKPIMLLGTIGALIAFMLAVYTKLPLAVLTPMLFIFGFCSSTMLLGFAMNIELAPSWASGLVIGFTNMIVMLGGTIFQPLVGVLLDRISNDAVTFSASDYQSALFMLPLCQVLAFVLIFFIKEPSNDRQ